MVVVPDIDFTELEDAEHIDAGNYNQQEYIDGYDKIGPAVVESKSEIVQVAVEDVPGFPGIVIEQISQGYIYEGRYKYTCYGVYPFTPERGTENDLGYPQERKEIDHPGVKKCCDAEYKTRFEELPRVALHLVTGEQEIQYDDHPQAAEYVFGKLQMLKIKTDQQNEKESRQEGTLLDENEPGIQSDNQDSLEKNEQECNNLRK